MGGNGFLFLLIAVSLISAASSSRSVVGFRKLAAAELSNASQTRSNLPVSKARDNTSNDQSKKTEELDSPMISDEKRPDVSVTVNPPDEQKVSKKDTNMKNEAGMNEQTGIGESCNEKPNNCSNKGALSACILASVEFMGFTSMQEIANDNKRLQEVLKHQTKKVVPGRDMKLVLNAGHGDCTPLIGRLVHSGKMAYTSLPLTPINGVYLSVLTVAILAGFVACWNCRKTRQGEARYQQLEMGSRGEAPGAMNVERTGDGIMIGIRRMY